MSESTWISTTGSNFKTLNHWVSTRNWYAADQETLKLLLQMSQCSEEFGLDPEGLRAIAAVDLQLLDQLWMEHSSGQFGLSAQRTLWHQCGQPRANIKDAQMGDWYTFWRRLAWSLGEDWFRYPKISLAQGQLPFLIWHIQGKYFRQHGKTWQAYQKEWQKTAQLMEILFERQDW